MGAMLYREGDKAEIRGVKCEFVVVPLRSVPGHLALGWKKRVEELYQEEAPAEVEAQPKFQTAAEAAKAAPKLSNKQVREKAREAGIDGWDRRQVGKLKEDLGIG